MGKNRRSPCREFKLYDDDMSRGWRVVHNISFDEGKKLELAGAARIYDPVTGKHEGWQRTASQRKADEGDSFGRETHELMNVAEIHKVAGLRGRSRTYGLPMNDERRLIRVSSTGKMLKPEDPIERAIVKCRILGEERLPLPVRVIQAPKQLAAAAD